MKVAFTAAVFLLISFITRAQHCPYDGAGLLVVSVTTEEGYGFTEDNILISVRDVYGNIIYRSGTPEIFVLNPKQTSPFRSTYDHEKISYGFAGNNFIHAIPAYLVNEYEEKGGVYLYINPLRGDHSPVIRRLSNKDIYDIHYINEYVSYGNGRTEPVPENKTVPFAPFLMKFVLAKQVASR